MKMQRGLDELKKAFLIFDAKKAEDLVKEALSSGADPREVAKVFLDVIEKAERDAFGDAVFRHNIKSWIIPHPLRIYELARRLHDKYLKPVLKPWLGKKVVVGNMAPDVHAYGAIYGSMALELAGFEVRYLGVNIEPEVFVEEAKKYDVLVFTGLMAEAYPNMEKLMKMLKEKGLRERVKVAAAGTIPYEIAVKIGADGYLNCLSLAVKTLKHLTGIKTYSKDEVPTIIKDVV